jgi:hypothetical protein
LKTWNFEKPTIQTYNLIMKKIWLVIIILGTLTSCLRSQVQAPVSGKDCIVQPGDREIFEKILKETGDVRDLSAPERVIRVARFFLGTPYVANTLEKGDTEKLVINLRELDCTTYAENCLALARTLLLKNPDFDDFLRELQFIRYRDGKRDGYPSRLHYFSDWIYNNDQKKTVKSMSKEIAHTLVPNQVNFMSKHPGSYPILKVHPGLISEIDKQEKEISHRMTWFIPKNRLAVVENKLQDGDILGIATNIEGMDISHVVISLRVNGRIHFIHASSRDMKVVISEGTLEEYLLNSKMAAGIMVARPL